MVLVVIFDRRRHKFVLIDDELFFSVMTMPLLQLISTYPPLPINAIRILVSFAFTVVGITITSVIHNAAAIFRPTSPIPAITCYSHRWLLDDPMSKMFCSYWKPIWSITTQADLLPISRGDIFPLFATWCRLYKNHQLRQPYIGDRLKHHLRSNEYITYPFPLTTILLCVNWRIIWRETNADRRLVTQPASVVVIVKSVKCRVSSNLMNTYCMACFMFKWHANLKTMPHI